MFASLDISIYVVFALGATTGLIYVLWQWTRAHRLQHFINHTEQERDYAEQLPPVSIIIDACSETGQLEDFLPQVLQQQYPDFEVIVVTNNASENTDDTLSSLKAEFNNLHITFAPKNTRTLSRKKLALMIGIKAAQHDIVLTTNANCRPTSDQWLYTMMRNFTPETDIVLGYSHYDYSSDKRWGRQRRIFDTTSTGAQWINSAIKGHPYRGTGDNLAYRKQLFYDHKGFAKSMELRWGEDDVFLSEIAQGAVTKVELLPESQIEVHFDNLRHTHPILKMRRDFTSRLVRRRSFITQAFMSWMWWLAHLLLIAAVVVSWPNPIMWIAAPIAMLLLWAAASWATARTNTVLQAPRQCLLAPLLALWRPLANFVFRLRESRNDHSNYTAYI